MGKESFYVTATVKTLYVRFCENAKQWDVDSQLSQSPTRRFLADPGASAMLAKVFATVELDEPDMVQDDTEERSKPGSPWRVPFSPNDAPVVFEDVLVMGSILQQFDTSTTLPKLPRVISQPRCVQKWRELLVVASGGANFDDSAMFSGSGVWENLKVAAEDVRAHLECDRDVAMHVVVPVELVVSLVEAERSRLQGLLWKNLTRKGSRDASPSAPSLKDGELETHLFSKVQGGDQQAANCAAPMRDGTTLPASRHVDPTSKHQQATTTDEPSDTPPATPSRRLSERRSSAELREDALQYLRHSRTPNKSGGGQSSEDIRNRVLAKLEAQRSGAFSSAVDTTSTMGLSPIPCARPDEESVVVAEESANGLPARSVMSPQGGFVPVRSRIRDMLKGSASAIFRASGGNSETRTPSTTSPQDDDLVAPDARGNAPEPTPRAAPPSPPVSTPLPVVSSNPGSPSPKRTLMMDGAIGDSIVGSMVHSSPRQLPSEKNGGIAGPARKDQCTQYEEEKPPMPAPVVATVSKPTKSSLQKASAPATSRLTSSSRHASMAPSFSREGSAATAPNQPSFSRNTSRQRSMSPNSSSQAKAFKPPSGGRGGTFADVRHLPPTPRRAVESPSRVMAALREQERSLRERQELSAAAAARQQPQQVAHQDVTVVSVSSSARVVGGPGKRRASSSSRSVTIETVAMSSSLASTRRPPHEETVGKRPSTSSLMGLSMAENPRSVSYANQQFNSTSVLISSRTSSPAPTHRREAPPAPRLVTPRPDLPRAPSPKPTPLRHSGQ